MVRKCNPYPLTSTCPNSYLAGEDGVKEDEKAVEEEEGGLKEAIEGLDEAVREMEDGGEDGDGGMEDGGEDGDGGMEERKLVAEYCSSYTAVIYSSGGDR